ncbi:ESPR-type extended signal peptide-containing protein [Pseudomonas putida]
MNKVYRSIRCAATNAWIPSTECASIAPSTCRAVAG